MQDDVRPILRDHHPLGEITFLDPVTMLGYRQIGTAQNHSIEQGGLQHARLVNVPQKNLDRNVPHAVRQQRNLAADKFFGIRQLVSVKGQQKVSQANYRRQSVIVGAQRSITPGQPSDNYEPRLTITFDKRNFGRTEIGFKIASTTVQVENNVAFAVVRKKLIEERLAFFNQVGRIETRGSGIKLHTIVFKPDQIPRALRIVLVGSPMA